MEQAADLALVCDEWRVPGMVVGVTNAQTTLWEAAIGYRDYRAHHRLMLDTRFAIGSLTKAFTCAALAILVDQQRLAWDTPLKHYLPTLELCHPDLTAQVTLRDVLLHRTGLASADHLWTAGQLSRAQLFDHVLELPQSAALRSEFRYNNLPYIFADLLIRHQTGMRWEAFVEQRLLLPLQLRHTACGGFDLLPDDVLAWPHWALPDPERPVVRSQLRNLDAIGPAAAMHSTLADLLVWARFQLGDGTSNGRSLLSPTRLLELQTPQIVATSRMDFPEIFFACYGLGWYITAYRGHVRVSHDGGIDGYTSRLMLFPHAELAIVVLANLHNTPAVKLVSNLLADYYLHLPSIDWAARMRER
jgi:CubicO group peptidase (beta-lactamase class C family)